MSLIDRLANTFGFTRRDETRSDSGSVFSFGTSTDAGVPVTPELALTHSAVWACVMAISEAFATMPVHVIEQDGGGRAKGHGVSGLMHNRPNEYMGSTVFRSAMMVNAALWGRAVAVIDRDDLGRPIALYPVPTKHLHVERVGGVMRYHIRIPGTEWVTLRPDEVFDLLWMSIDGVTALGPIQYARHTVGLSLATNRYASRFFGNNGSIGGIIKTGGLSGDAVKKFMASWREKYVGSSNAFKLAALPEGMDFMPIGTDPEKGQMIDTRSHQVVEICRIFGVPPHKVQDYSSMKWANIEHSQIEWSQGTLLPWAVRWEQEADAKLFLEAERDRLELKFNLDALLRADNESRTRALAAEVASGLRTLNEARSLLDLPPVKGGDESLRPANTVPLTYAPEPTRNGGIASAQERSHEQEQPHAAA